MNTTKYALLPVAASMFLLLSSFQSPEANKLAFRNDIQTIVIDAGHGGKDPGCISNKKNEKTVTLGVALKLGKMLKDSLPGVNVVYTRNKDVFIELHERAMIANKNNADLFISIHVNHNANTTAHGSETYVMGTHKNNGNLDVAKRENSSILLEDDYDKSYEGFDPNSPEAHIIFSFYQNVFIEQSIYFASKIEHRLSKRKKTNYSRGVKQAGFLVLWKTAMPSVLIETGFLSNKEDREYLTSEDGQQEIAKSVYGAVADYMKYVEKLK